jgi:hypothetical protein
MTKFLEESHGGGHDSVMEIISKFYGDLYFPSCTVRDCLGHDCVRRSEPLFVEVFAGISRFYDRNRDIPNPPALAAQFFSLFFPTRSAMRRSSHPLISLRRNFGRRPDSFTGSGKSPLGSAILASNGRWRKPQNRRYLIEIAESRRWQSKMFRCCRLSHASTS